MKYPSREEERRSQTRTTILTKLSNLMTQKNQMTSEMMKVVHGILDLCILVMKSRTS